MASAHLRSLYRSILRELPPLPKASPSSPLRASIRTQFSTPPIDGSAQYSLARRQETEQVVQYLKAQRVYNTLLERYNPGMTMEDEERTRLTARRVGMEMPVEFKDLARELEKGKGEK
jgi:ATP synthase assembly factor FMC1